MLRREVIKMGGGLFGLGAGTPSRFPYAGRPQPSPAVGPSSATIVRANRVIVTGPGGGIYVYSGPPASGNLIESIGIATAGFDPFHLNAVLQGDTRYHNNGVTFVAQNSAASIIAGLYQATSALGPYTNTSFQIAFAGDLTTAPMLQSQGTMQQFIGLGSATEIWVFPSGDTTGATDVANINFALTRATSGVRLVAATVGQVYSINAPIVIPGSNTFLEGVGYAPASTKDIYNSGGAVGQPGGTEINMVSTFAGDAAISFPDPGAASTSQRYNVRLANFTINGNNITTGTIPGIHVTGAWGACVMEGVTVHRAPGDCITFSSGTGGAIADDWYLRACKMTGSRNGNGCTAAFLDDSWIDCCEFSENHGHGFVLSGGTNTRFTGSKAENNATGHGWYFQGLASAGELVYMSACSTHLNNQDGFHFDNAGGTALGNYHLTGCHAQADGQSAAATNAGFGTAACKSRIMLASCTCTANATGPAFGANAISVSFGLEAQMCLLAGVTAATHDDGTNTHVLSNLNAWAF